MEPPHDIGEPIVFTGYVDDFEHGIAAMEFSLDDGLTWTRYATGGARTDAGVRWSFAYTPKKSGIYVLKSRAVNKKGEPSPIISSQAFEVRA